MEPNSSMITGPATVVPGASSTRGTTGVSTYPASASKHTGRPLVAEVPNLTSLLTFTRAWTLDPTHRQALHPQTLAFLAERAGFARVEIAHGGEPEPGLLLEGAGDADPAARNVDRLNRLLLGPQDCAVIAWA